MGMPRSIPIFVEYSGFHLLGKSENNGCENGETRMIERLCLILKYALDSSNPYISLQEEVDCAKEYLAIQQLRKTKNFCKMGYS